jgi:hypothetical protein
MEEPYRAVPAGNPLLGRWESSGNLKGSPAVRPAKSARPLCTGPVLGRGLFSSRRTDGGMIVLPIEFTIRTLRLFQ